jgi:5-methylcytosine-specific restriction endonuclease McrA
MHRVFTIMTWVNRFRKFCSVASISVERVKFDMQSMQNPEISGVEYQQGTLQGYTVKEYLLEKWNRTCAYCGVKNVPLEVEHIVPRANQGNNRVSNLTLACHDCNEQKGRLSAETFLKNKPDVLKRIMAQAKQPLLDAAAINSTRNALLVTLSNTGLTVETGTGAQTKFNRKTMGYPKNHWIDAACTGDSGNIVVLNHMTKPFLVKAMGHGTRQMCRNNKYGFPIKYKTRQASHFGFSTGDIVKAVVPKGKCRGTHVARVSVRATGQFTLTGVTGSANYRYCSAVHRKDGYDYGRPAREGGLCRERGVQNGAI